MSTSNQLTSADEADQRFAFHDSSGDCDEEGVSHSLINDGHVQTGLQTFYIHFLILNSIYVQLLE